MALVVADRVQETSLTSGTGTLTFAGAVAGFQTFSTGIGNGNTTYYTIYDPTNFDWEVGIGTVGAGTLSRDTVLSNSLGTTSPISLAGNVATVFCTYPAEKSINYDVDGVATIGEPIGYTDTGIIGSFASTVAGYNQVIIQNLSNATNASSNLNVSNNVSTDTTGFAELGINSSTFTGTGSFSIPSAAYLASAGTDLTIGTYNANDIHFVTNSSTVDAMIIHDGGGIALGTYGDPGPGNIAVNKIVPGFQSITSAGGTTVLTSASTYYQRVVGTSTETIQLPDATTLLNGTTFNIDNDSTQDVTVTDGATTVLDTIVSGSLTYIYLINNGTVAGTWTRYHFLPNSYDFGTTSANFGGAVISNATYEGNTVATGYGGTGLTGFTAANNAIYSTSSSALTAGTLPVAAGGTGDTTLTVNGVLYGNGTSAVGVTAAGTTGQVLVGNTGSAPSWATVSSSLVSSFQTSLSGLTPSTPTTGAVTLAGTLGISSGGTGQTTANDALNALLPSQSTNSGKYLTTDGTDSSWATVTQTTFSAGTTGFTPNTPTSGTVTLGGTLNVSNGGTGQSSNLTQYGVVYGATTSAMGTTSAGTSTQVLHGNAGGAPTWGAVDLANDITGTLGVGNGGTGQTSYTDGQLLIGNSTGNTLAKSTLTQGTGITITNGSGAITIANAGVTSFTSSSGLSTNTSATGAVSVTNTAPMVYPGAGIPNSTGSAWGTSYTTQGSGTVVALATSPTFTTSIDGGATFGAFASSTTLTLGYTGTGAGSTTNINTGAATTGTKTINIGTAGTTGSVTAVNIGSSVSGTTTIRGAVLVGAASASTTDGAIFATNNITAFAASDIRFKENVRDIPNALDKVNVIGGKLFDWSTQYIESMGGEHSYFMRKADAGVIAQDVEKVMPELVRTRDDGSLAVDYPKLVALAFAAIKELKAEIDELKGK